MTQSLRTILVISLAVVVPAGCGSARQSQQYTLPPAAADAVRNATGYRSLYSFGAIPDGQDPRAALIEVSGALYSTTYAGGKYGDGTVFTISTNGTESVLHSFQPYIGDGLNPSASLIAVKGLLYGTTEYGGYPSSGGCNAGTVFSISTSGVEKVVYPFYGYYCHDHVYNDGGNPVASLIYVKGRLYGTTFTGGSNECCGTVFRVSTSGREKVLYSFDGGFADGANPAASLIDVKGVFYGTTQLGGQLSSEGGGTVFSVTGVNAESLLYKFDPYGSDGAIPLAGLIDVKGTLYGTTWYGGPNSGGTAFGITTAGHVTDLHNFGLGPDGSAPAAPLLNVHDTLYGTTSAGGAYGKGTIFKMSLTGREKVLHSFGRGSDGSTPLAGLRDLNGTLYGTTSAGGAYGNGTVFAFALPR